MTHKQSTEEEFKSDHRRLIREAELQVVVPHIPGSSKVLEIGAGAGWQANYLSKLGFDLTAIEIASSNYQALREFDIIDYDGLSIPLPDSSVDVIFSSNVLEHVPHIVDFQKEMQRVLKPGGVAIHVMPTATWRIWTSLTFYVRRLLWLFKKLFGGKKKRTSQAEKDSSNSQAYANPISRALLPVCHGVRGNVVSEAYFFSEFYWTRLFLSQGWKVEKVLPNRLFYSGNRILGSILGLKLRRLMSYFLGSSCKIYILRPFK